MYHVCIITHMDDRVIREGEEQQLEKKMEKKPMLDEFAAIFGLRNKS